MTLRGNILGITAILLCNLFSSRALAAPDLLAGVRSGVEPKIADMISLLSDGRVDAMIEKIGPIPEHDREAFEQTRERLIHLYSTAGKYQGFDMVGYKTLTPRFHVAYVLVYFEKRPVMLAFGFYRVDDKWRAQTLAVETDFKALLETLPLQR